MRGPITKDKLVDILKSSGKKVCMFGLLRPVGGDDEVCGFFELNDFSIDLVFKKYNSFELEECKTFWALTLVNEKQKAI